MPNAYPTRRSPTTSATAFAVRLHFSDKYTAVRRGIAFLCTIVCRVGFIIYKLVVTDKIGGKSAFDTAFGYDVGRGNKAVAFVRDRFDFVTAFA